MATPHSQETSLESSLFTNGDAPSIVDGQLTISESNGNVAQQIEGAYLDVALTASELGRKALTNLSEALVVKPREGADAADTEPAIKVEEVLTKRELEVFDLLKQGLSNSAIAKALWIEQQTVKFHLSNTYKKLGVGNRTEAVKAGAAGENTLSDEEVHSLPGVSELTNREKEVLQKVSEGLSNSQLAKVLGVTEQTVKFHLSNAYRKLDVGNRTEAAATGRILPAEDGNQKKLLTKRQKTITRASSLLAEASLIIQKLKDEPKVEEPLLDESSDQSAEVIQLHQREEPLPVSSQDAGTGPGEIVMPRGVPVGSNSIPPVRSKGVSGKEYASAPPSGTNLNGDPRPRKKRLGVFAESFYLMESARYTDYGEVDREQDLSVEGTGDPWEEPFRHRIKEAITNLRGINLLSGGTLELNGIGGSSFNTLRRLMHEEVIPPEQFHDKKLNTDSVVALLVFPYSWNVLRRGTYQKQAKQIIRQEVDSYFAAAHLAAA